MNKTQNYIKAKKILFDKYKIEIKLELVWTTMTKDSYH
jgi:hypothetical protein